MNITELDIQPLKYADTPKRGAPFCDKHGYDRVHNNGKEHEDSEFLSGIDLRLYQTALIEAGGVSAPDARKQVKALRERYRNANFIDKARITEVIGHAFEGLIGSSPAREEVVVFRQKP